jgi:hypothetical protein
VLGVVKALAALDPAGYGLDAPPRSSRSHLCSLEQRQRFQQLFFPEGIAFDGKRFVGTRVSAPAFSYLQGIDEGLVDLTGIEPVTS